MKLNRKLVILVVALLLGSLAFAGSPAAPVSRGNFLRNPQYATQSALTLYVDPTGSDANPCTASGTAACLTLQAANNKIPKLVRHPVTVNVATGNYAGLGVNGFSFDAADVTNGAYINWVGTLITATVATGTATGTATGGTAGSTTGPVFGTLTDTGQAWTVDNLKGKIITITGGTGSGQQQIVSTNSATVITITGTWTAPVGASSTYAVQDWGSVVNTAVASSTVPGTTGGNLVALRIDQNGAIRASLPFSTARAGAAINFTSMKFAPGTAGQTAVRVNGSSQIAFSLCSINGNTTGNGINQLNSSQIFGDNNYITSPSFSAFSATFSNASSTNVYWHGTLFEGSVNVVSPGSNGSISLCQVNNNNATGTAFIVGSSGATGSFIGSSIIKCTVAGASKGIMATNSGATVGLTVQLSTVTSCDIGLLSDSAGSNIFLTGASTFTGTGAQTTGLKAILGGRIVIGTNPTISGYTADLTVDGTTMLFTDFTALLPTAVSTTKGSYIVK